MTISKYFIDTYGDNQWCVEFSKEQKQFHVQKLKLRNEINTDGYQVIGIYDTEEIANNHLDIFYDASINKPDLFKSLIDVLDELEADCLSAAMAMKMTITNIIEKD